MLARSAQGLYWMSRYLERAEHLCRMLRLQSEIQVDRPLREIHFGWSRIYGSIGRQPPLGEIAVLDDEDDALADSFALADSYTLADDLTFVRSNPASVWSCFALGRENARQMRRNISAEMWTHLNLAYLRIQALDMELVWPTSPESFYAETATEIDTFAGVAAVTMYRDVGWRFMQLGRAIERAQLTASLLLAQISVDKLSSESADADWTSLLRLYHAFEAYNRRFSVEVVPDQVLDLLATDPMLPGSLCSSLEASARELEAIGAGPDPAASAAALRLAGRMTSLVHYEWPDREDREGLLRQLGEHCRDMHERITHIYFDYPVEDLPTR